MKRDIPYYQKALRDELQRRCDKNPRYSIRAFANAVGIESSSLTQILNGTRAISAKLVERIFAALEMTPIEQKKFIDSLIEEKQNTKTGRVSGKLLSKAIGLNGSLRNSRVPDEKIDMETFRAISDWYHSAILELTFSPNFKADPRWIARILGISTVEAKLAFERLFDLGLLERTESGAVRKTTVSLQTADQTKTSEFHRRRQRQILEKSIYSLENDPIAERNHSGITLCLDPDQIPEAKTRIQNFLWELTEILESGSPRRVYELGVHLIPLQKKEKVLS